MTTLVPGDRYVPWAEEVALEASLVPMKHEVVINSDALPETTDPERVMRYVDIGNVDSIGRILGVQELTFEKAPSRARRVVRDGDTIVSTVRTYLRAIAHVERRDLDLICSTGFAVLRSRGRIHPRFLYYWLRSDPVVDEICARSVGVSYPALNASELGSLPIPVLGDSHQASIATYLDRKTAAIDDLIAKKERLVELLEEKRQALITQAVTKGLDPSVPMKESGVPPIGMIPSHWRLSRLMYLTPPTRQIMYGIVLPGPHVDGGIPIVKSGDCSAGKLRLDKLNRTTPEIEAPYARARLRPDDIVYAIRGSIGASAIVPPELDRANLTQDAARIAPKAGVNSRWLLLAVQAGCTWTQLEPGIVGATVRGINIRDLKRPYLPVPPVEEQITIATHVASRLSAMASTVEMSQTSIDRLREYRQALITAAVTGQIAPEKLAADRDDVVEKAEAGGET